MIDLQAEQISLEQIPLEHNLSLDNKDIMNVNIFEKIYSDSKSINFPLDWHRIIPVNKKNVIFCTILLKADLTPYFEKAVIIDEQATVKLFLLNTIQINVENLELNSNVILDLREIENIILKFSNTTICTGTFIPKELITYNSNTTWCIDNIYEQFHHSKCLFVCLPSNAYDNSTDNLTPTTKCKFCSLCY